MGSKPITGVLVRQEDIGHRHTYVYQGKMAMSGQRRHTAECHVMTEAETKVTQL